MNFSRKLTVLKQIANSQLLVNPLRKHVTPSMGMSQELQTLLKRSFPNAIKVVVTDISGGCGKLFKIFVESEDFRGLSILKQHRAVTGALRDQIKQFHALRIETKVPERE